MNGKALFLLRQGPAPDRKLWNMIIYPYFSHDIKKPQVKIVLSFFDICSTA